MQIKARRYELPTVDEVSQLAHASFIAQGRIEGRAVDHWLQAEALPHAPYPRRILLVSRLSVGEAHLL